MHPRRVRFTAAFHRAYRKLSDEERRAVDVAVKAFIDRSRENALRPERKAGLRGMWAFRVDLGLRVFYTQERDAEGRISELFHVGRHDDYRIIARRRP
jgi:mRNA-degrading endonuclease RelE of RelBE toxin-antitoxin system